MANSRVGNKILVDSTGEVVAQGPIKVSSILFTPDSANDEMILRETASGLDCFHIRGAVAKDTKFIDFLKPIVFQNGIYVQSLSSGAKAVLITTSSGE